MNKVIKLRNYSKNKRKRMQIFCLYSKSYEESIFDTDNSKIIYFDNKFRSWFSALQILEKTFGNIQKFYVFMNFLL